MTEGALVDRLDHTVDVILKRGDATAALTDQELAPLARLAADLRHYPSPEFKSRLRANLERRTTMASAIVSTRAREGFTTITPYLRVREAGLLDFLASPRRLRHPPTPWFAAHLPKTSGKRPSSARGVLHGAQRRRRKGAR